jgi:hypothetical protein
VDVPAEGQDTDQRNGGGDGRGAADAASLRSFATAWTNARHPSPTPGAITRGVSCDGDESGPHRIYIESSEARDVSSIRDVRHRLLTPEHVAITVAVALSVVGAYVIRLRIGAGVAAFFGLIALGVSTPTTLTSHDLLGTRVAAAVVRTGAACTATFVTYLGLLIVGSGSDGSPLGAAVAFTLTALAVEAAARTLA